jgi:DNA-binding MarR family transcriptional regulator
MTTYLSCWKLLVNRIEAKTAYEVTWLVRRLFRAMGTAADHYLRSLGISAADRAVMEFLYPDTQLSVPQIADQYSVSRQHIQVTVNHLLETEILQSNVNPRHKRSQLMRLTAKGQDLFLQIRDRDDEILQQVFAGIPDEDVQVTRATLNSLLTNLS